MYTAGNVQEVVPGAITPLTIDVVTKTLERAMSEQLDGVLPGEEHYGRFFPTARFHLFMDVLKVPTF